MVFNVENLTEKQAKDDGCSFDEDGSLIMGGVKPLINSVFSFSYASPEPDKSNITTLTQDLKDLTALEILGLLIGKKQDRRKGLLNKLSVMGVKIN